MQRGIYKRKKNKFIDNGSYYKIELKNKNNKIVGYAKIDKDDYYRVKNYKWSLSLSGYVKSGSKSSCGGIMGRKVIGLHKFILGDNENFLIDHINRNRLDNRKNNLRFVTTQENLFNRSVSKNNTSGATGVYFNRRRWIARIKINNKIVCLGNFLDFNIAKKIRLNAEKKYHVILSR